MDRVVHQCKLTIQPHEEARLSIQAYCFPAAPKKEVFPYPAGNEPHPRPEMARASIEAMPLR